MTTKAQVHAAIDATFAVAEAIRKLGSVPAGHLYANLCGQLELTDLNNILGVLKRAGLVRERNHLLTWVGPEISE